MKRILLIFSILINLLIYGNSEISSDIFKEINKENQRFLKDNIYKLKEIKKEELEKTNFNSDSFNINMSQVIDYEIDKIYFISEINIEDNDNLLTENEKCFFNNKYRYKNLSNLDLSNILSEITMKLSKKGYITSYATVSNNNNLNDNIFNVKIVSGKIEDIVINEGNVLDKYKEFFMFNKNKGDILNIRDIEQATDNFNSIKSNNMKLDIKEGTGLDKSIIKVSNELKNKYTLSYTVNNHGESNQNGIWRHGVALKIDSPLGIGDNFNFSYQRVNRKNPDRSWKDSSDELGVGHILPIGPAGYSPEKDGALPYKRRLDMFNTGYSAKFRDYTLRMNFSKSIKDSSFYAFNTIYDMKTSNKVFDVNIDKVIFRDSKSKFSMGVGFKRKHNENYLEKAVLQDRKYAMGNINLSGIAQFLKGILEIDLGYERNSRIFGLKAEKEFEKYNYGVMYNKNITDKLMYKFSGNGMYSPYVLPGSEKYSIGGVGSVGGYNRQGAVSGDKAFELNNELSYKIKLNKIGEISPYLVYSYGKVRNNEDNSIYKKGYIIGTTIGIKYVSKYFDFNFGYGKPLNHSQYIKPRSDEVYFSGSVKFVF